MARVMSMMRHRRGFIVVCGLFILSGVFAAVSSRALPVGRPVYYDTRPAAPDGIARNYVVGQYRWSMSALSYSIRNCPSSLDCAVAQQVVRDSVEAWDAVSGLTLDEVSGEADINILWTVRFHGDGNPFDGPGLILAHAFPPIPWLGGLGGDVHLDDSEVWVTDTPQLPWEVHLPTTVTHEIGHALGLEHSAESSALMWAKYDGVRGIAPDDVAGIQLMYGPPEGAAPAGPTSVMATATTTLRMRSGPGTSYAQLASVPSGTTLAIIGRNDAANWLYVEYNGARGWVAAWYCNISGRLADVPVVSETGEGSGRTPAPENPPVEPSGVIATAAGNTRMRSGPGTSYLQVGTVPANTTVAILARNTSSQWLYVEFNGQRGWIAAWLCRITGDLNTVPIQDQ